MKFGTRNIEGRQEAIVRGGDGQVHSLADVTNGAGLGPIDNMMDLVKACDADSTLLNKLTPHNVEGFSEHQVDWAPPMPNPSMVLNVPFNNKELMRKAHVDPGVPNFFLKPPSCMIGHGKPIIVDPDWGAVIPEPEICAVIGKRAKHISEEQALDHVFGFLIHNDVTSHGLKFTKDSIAVTYDADMARPEFYKWRRLHGDNDTDAYFVYHTRSKGTDTFGPVGPWITTRDEIADPNDLYVTGTLNGDVFTRDHTGNYRFTIEQCRSQPVFHTAPGRPAVIWDNRKGQ